MKEHNIGIYVNPTPGLGPFVQDTADEVLSDPYLGLRVVAKSMPKLPRTTNKIACPTADGDNDKQKKIPSEDNEKRSDGDNDTQKKSPSKDTEEQEKSSSLACQ